MMINSKKREAQSKKALVKKTLAAIRSSAGIQRKKRKIPSRKDYVKTDVTQTPCGIETVPTSSPEVRSGRKWHSMTGLDNFHLTSNRSTPTLKPKLRTKQLISGTNTLADEIQRSVMLETKLIEEKGRFKLLENKYKNLLANFSRAEEHYENEISRLIQHLDQIKLKSRNTPPGVTKLQSQITHIKDLLAAAEETASEVLSQYC